MVTLLLCTAQQELSIRKRYQLQRALPKDMALLCSNENIPITDKLFGDDADKAIKRARETFKIKNYHSGGQQLNPYKRGQNRCVFLEPERSRKVQGGKITNSKKSERWTKGGRDFCDSAPSILEELQKQSEDFRAGQIHFCLAQWKQITIDKKILKMVEGKT